MGTSTPNTSGTSAGGTITLPPGVTIRPGRETSQTNDQGQVQQGTLYPIVLANGTTSSVFVPNSALSNPAIVQALFENKVNGLNAIPIG